MEILKKKLVDYPGPFLVLLGAFIGIGLIVFLQSFYLIRDENVFFIGSFGEERPADIRRLNTPLISAALLYPSFYYLSATICGKHLRKSAGKTTR
ncbi:hypothetical protein ACFS6H_08740 [Terrimonas rubra]|uniref:Uncharacterized protein n=1 Tax=Terrimonas rubra TaxID=1035890 RepID=A0ABW6A5R0_9BACT